MDHEKLISMLLSQQWEKCKGELRAFVALKGSKYTRDSTEYEILLELINEFIKEVEDNEFQY